MNLNDIDKIKFIELIKTSEKLLPIQMNQNEKD
jgi:hypothetical protein